MNKKVLIITYYWPPSGGIGVHRCLKFAKYLRQFGWEPVIYTAANAHYPYLDESNFKHIPEGITVLKKNIIEPFSFYKRFTGKQINEPMSNPLHIRGKKQNWKEKLSIWLRGNFFIPDARSLWIRPSVSYLTEYLSKNPVDAIISDGPPHTNTTIACRVSQKTGIPWLADFQDPWTQVDYYKLFPFTRRADNKHKRLEQDALKTAKKTTIASPTWKKDLENIGGHNVDVIYWGYDEDDFEGAKSNKNPDEFVISHAGLFGFDRLPDQFFKALSELKAEYPEFSKKLRIKLAGMIDFSVLESLKQNGLNENFQNLGNLKREEALQLTLDSDLLLLPLNKADNIMGRVPGKLFEQLRSNNPILVLGPHGSDVQHIVESSGCGKSFNYDEKEALKSFTNSVFEKEITFSAGDITEYSVKNQVKKLSVYLNSISQ
ncbi:MAG: glycosyl transferase family 1 [Bacteroidetes bacterium HGW-Bacteroidetes-21]|nr:MAG: glycosyl transferase family 1 [Bacteroidetes bacterium HGW-Bacteroidetes-21]